MNRLVHRVYKQVILDKPYANTRAVILGLLRGVVEKATAKGYIVIYYKSLYYSKDELMELNYSGEAAFRVIADTIYIGRKRCLSASLRRIIRSQLKK